MKVDIAVIGGGAAGFFSAITCKNANPNLSVVILEQGKEVLGKVRISGGGRCNVTHGCWDPRDLVSNYPRGSKELLGPFNKFACGDTMEWYDSRGVELKIENDGRVFPVSDDSASIVNCLLDSARELGIRVYKGYKIEDINHDQGKFVLKSNQDSIVANKIMVASGSSKFVWKILKKLGHTIVEPVPSLFAFNCNDTRFKNLAGLSVPNATVAIPQIKLEEVGPILITHKGVSGPGILKLSSRGAKMLSEINYKFDIVIDWAQGLSINKLKQIKEDWAQKQISTLGIENIPNRLWKSLIGPLIDKPDMKWKELQGSKMDILFNGIKESTFYINGKSTNKEEFVTAGGVELKEVNFKKFESKLIPNLFLAGEVLNIDAVTGGFNFQAAWTGGYLAGLAMGSEVPI